MEPSACRLAYLDDRFPTDRWITRGSTAYSHEISQSANRMVLPADLQANLDAILQVFTQVYVCKSGRMFSSKLAEMQESSRGDCTPILALFDIAPDIRHNSTVSGQPRIQLSPSEDDAEPISLQRSYTFSTESDETYGLQLLSRIASDLQIQDHGVLIIPIAVTRSRPGMEQVLDERHEKSDGAHGTQTPSSHPSASSSSSSGSRPSIPNAFDSHLMLRCLEAGAVDVILGPLDPTRVLSLNSHTYKAYKTARRRQSSFLSNKKFRRASWVGMDEQKPYAYLRESMVEKLMNRICHPEAVVEDTLLSEADLSEKRQSEIAVAVGRWDFCSHDFSDEELVYGAACMLNHAVEMKELERWRISFDELLSFIQSARSAYNSFVIYHNFKHAIDVLQSVFYFLVQIAVLPPYPRDQKVLESPPAKAPLASLVKPFEALTLLIAAIGHDVGHPGVNNMFLVKLNAPLAQLYNDQSVLESFHCAAYSQILRRHWWSAFDDRELRKLLISTILATDMGLHSSFMQQLALLQAKSNESRTMDEWMPKDLETYRVLVCGLLIKCADISNVSRPWAVAERWTYLLQEEFAHQGEMEKQVGIESCLFGGPPEIGNMLKLANGQIGFMSLFGLPLFQGISSILPTMSFAAQHITSNKAVWLERAEQEKAKEKHRAGSSLTEGALSPRSQSPKVGDKHLDSRLLGSPRGSPSPPFFPRTSVDEVLRGSSLRDSSQSPRTVPGGGESTPISPGAPLPVPAFKEAKSALRHNAVMHPDATGQSPSSLQARRSSNTSSTRDRQLSLSGASNPTMSAQDSSTTATSHGGGSSENERPEDGTFSAGYTGEKTSARNSTNSDFQRVCPSSGAVSAPSAVDRNSANTVTEPSRATHHPDQPGSSGVDECSKHTISTIMTPASTKATSILSESADETPRENGDFHGLNTSASNESKNNFRATILGHTSLGWRTPPNSGGNNGNGHENGIPKTLPRRRSRMKLAFWKRSRSHESGEVSPS